MKVFFDSVRAAFGPLSDKQVKGINVLLYFTSSLSTSQRAYVLATAWHETARTMQPIYERGIKSYFNKYEPETKIGRDLGNTMKGDGFKYRGRGFVQITGRANYNKMSSVVGVDLVENPDKALELNNAALIIVTGMTRGMFTGKRMADYVSYIDMRRVVNGTDKATMIAGYANKFEFALTEQARVVPAVTVQPDPAMPVPDAPPVKRGLLTALIDLIMAIFGRRK